MNGGALTWEEDIVDDVDGGPRPEKITPTTTRLLDRYQRVTLAVKRDSGATRATLSVDGVLAATYDADPAAANGVLSIAVGDCQFAAVRNWTIHVDNIVIDGK